MAELEKVKGQRISAELDKLLDELDILRGLISNIQRRVERLRENIHSDPDSRRD